MDDCYSLSESLVTGSGRNVVVMMIATVSVYHGHWVRENRRGLVDCYSVSESLVPGSGKNVVVWMIATV